MVRIITDSSADLEPREYEQLGITCIPLTVFFGVCNTFSFHFLCDSCIGKH